MHPKLIRAIVFLLVAAAVNSSPALGQEEPGWKAQIRRAWQARQEAARTLQIEFRSAKRMPSLAAILAGRTKIEWEQSEWEFEVSLSGRKFSVRRKEVEENGLATPVGARAMRDTFDGEKTWSYSGTSHASKVGTGKIDGLPYSSGTNLVDIMPVTFSFRPLNVALARFDLTKSSLRGQSEMVDGRACWLVEDAQTHAGMGRSYRLWLDPTRGFLPLRIQCWVNGRVSYRTDIDPREHEQLGWLPDKWDHTWVDTKTGDLKGSIKSHVTSVGVNENIPDSEFVIAFPVGTHVDDRITGTSYVQEAPSHLQTWLVVVLVIAVVVTFGTVYWSHSHRHKRLESVKGASDDGSS